MYASSSFYSPFHPTVQDQVELARRISSSLCDISNKQSKGQSMYVNRMKRSVKWVHGGEGQGKGPESTYANEDSTYAKQNSDLIVRNSTKNSLKLVMNPHGKVQDLNSLAKQGLVIQPPLSPELCFDLVKDLNATRGKVASTLIAGAELFAKRRKKSEKWVVDENTVRQSNPSAAAQYNVDRSHLQPMDSQRHDVQVSGFHQPPMPWTRKVNESNTLRQIERKANPPVGYNNQLYMPNIPKGWTSSSYSGDHPSDYRRVEELDSSSTSRTVLPQLSTNKKNDFPSPKSHSTSSTSHYQKFVTGPTKTNERTSACNVGQGTQSEWSDGRELDQVPDIGRELLELQNKIIRIEKEIELKALEENMRKVSGREPGLLREGRTPCWMGPHRRVFPSSESGSDSGGGGLGGFPGFSEQVPNAAGEPVRSDEFSQLDAHHTQGKTVRTYFLALLM
ncbi:hypothetical protein RUM43_001376 [Polyplax serrata]|uniref:Uncharacterized protein n=1 Tax=Polyplax serrata TaxID=468196 RepID=A0AAN8XQK1_POLSC